MHVIPREISGDLEYRTGILWESRVQIPMQTLIMWHPAEVKKEDREQSISLANMKSLTYETGDGETVTVELN